MRKRISILKPAGKVMVFFATGLALSAAISLPGPELGSAAGFQTKRNRQNGFSDREENTNAMATLEGTGLPS
jgi:hypothetical protein